MGLFQISFLIKFRGWNLIKTPYRGRWYRTGSGTSSYLSKIQELHALHVLAYHGISRREELHALHVLAYHGISRRAQRRGGHGAAGRGASGSTSTSLHPNVMHALLRRQGHPRPGQDGARADDPDGRRQRRAGQ